MNNITSNPINICIHRSFQSIAAANAGDSLWVPKNERKRENKKQRAKEIDEGTMRMNVSTLCN